MHRYTGFITTIIVLTNVVFDVRAGVIEFWNDPDGWQKAVATHNIIDFTDFPVGTVITNQYQDMGIHFTNFVFIHNAQSYSDGAGLFGGEGVRIEFDKPQHAFAVDHLGVTSYVLYYKGAIVAQMNGWFSYGLPGPVYFSGIISDQPFDEVYLYKPQPPFSNNVISIDNLYWGMPIPAPGALPLLALGFMCSPRRRRR